MILIPAIDLKEGHCVRLRQGNMEDSTVFSEDPVAMAAKWEAQGCTRLHLVDLDGAFGGEPANADVIEVGQLLLLPSEEELALLRGPGR